MAESIIHATSLYGYGAVMGVPLNPTQSELNTNIEVESLIVNSARTSFQINMNYNPPIGLASTINFVRISYILVGSDFSGYHDDSGASSSYIFVRNS